MRNIEIKVRVGDLERVRGLAVALGARDRGSTHDVDTYFGVERESGRLKLRQSAGHSGGTLIYYERADEADSRPSDYSLLHVDEPEALKAMLGSALGVRVIVMKVRHLFVYGATRIHLDRVEALGSFVELETVMGSQSATEARAEHDLVRRRLELDGYEIVPVSYGDLLLPQPSAAADRR